MNQTTPRRAVFTGTTAGFAAGALAGFLFNNLWSVRDKPAPLLHSAEENAITLEGSENSSRKDSEPLEQLLDPKGAEGLQRTRDQLDFVEAVKPDEFGARLDEIFARRKGEQGHQLIDALYRQWVVHDPAAALRHAEGLDGRNRERAMYAVLHSWAKKQPHEVIAWVEERGNSRDTQIALGHAVETIAREDPRAALALLAGKSPAMRSLSPASVFSIWAEQDPQAASVHAHALPKTNDRRLALRSVAAKWAQSDPQAARDWAISLERSTDRVATMEMIVSEVLNNGDIDAGIAFLDDLPSGDSRDDALRGLAWKLAQRDPEAAFALVNEHAGLGVGEDSVANVFEVWAGYDPERAFEVAVAELDPGNARIRSIQSALAQIARRDAPKALGMLDTLDELTKDKIIPTISRGLATADPKLAIDWAEGLRNGERKVEAYSNILSEWAATDPRQACAHGLTIENPNTRRRALSSALSKWGRDDAAVAMTWAVENLAGEDQANFIPGNVLGSWTEEDPEAAADWVAALPEGELRDKSMASLVSQWSRHDLVATGEWLKRMPKGKGRDEAAATYAERVYESDPEAALIWAESIGDETRRFDWVAMLARQYLRHDPEKAKRWLFSSSLPRDRIERLLKEVE